MADQISINIKVIDNEVRPKLAQLKSDINRTFAGLDRSVALGAGGGPAGKEFQAQLAKTKADLLGMVTQAQATRNAFRASFRGGEEGARGFLHSLHGLGPLLAPLGLEVGNVRGLMAAARFGAVGLAGVIGGEMLVNLAKVGDEAIKTRQRLQDVFGGEFGKKVNEDLKKDAAALGTSSGTFAKPLEDLHVAGKNDAFRFAPGHEQSAPGAYEQQRVGLKALFEAMRAGGASEAEATKGLDAFTEALRKQKEEGKAVELTTQMVAELANASPRAANALAQALGKTDASALEESLRKNTVLLNQLISAFPQLAQKVKGSFDPANPKTFGDALDALKNKFDELAKSATGEDVSGVLAKAAKAVGDYVDKISGGINDVKGQVGSSTFKNPLSQDPSKISGVNLDLAAALGDLIIAIKGASAAIKAEAASFSPKNASFSPKNATPYTAATGGAPESGGDPFGASGTATDTPGADDALNKPVSTPGHNANILRRPGGPIGKLLADQRKAAAAAAEDKRKAPATPTDPKTRPVTIEELRFVPPPKKTGKLLPGRNQFGGLSFDNNGLITDYAPGQSPGEKPPTGASRTGTFIVPHEPDAPGFARGGAVDGYAKGGVIKGPGTSTSDSILIRASRDEGIVNARGMARIGRSGLDSINGYASGGVPGARPGAAAGGTTLQPVHVHFGDNEYQMQAHPQVADRIVSDANDRTASRRIRRSTGTKTSAYG